MGKMFRPVKLFSTIDNCSRPAFVRIASTGCRERRCTKRLWGIASKFVWRWAPSSQNCWVGPVGRGSNDDLERERDGDVRIVSCMIARFHLYMRAGNACLACLFWLLGQCLDSSIRQAKPISSDASGCNPVARSKW